MIAHCFHPGRVLSLILLSVNALLAAPVALVNPSGEENNGIDRTVVPHPSFPGWAGANGQVIHGGTDGGNGAWRISLGSGGEVRQMTNHVIQTGEAFSLRFEAATFSGLPVAVTAEFFTETTPGTVTTLFSKLCVFSTLTSGSWEGFQLVSGFGELDAAAGQAIGVRFRNTEGAGKFLSVDDIRLESCTVQTSTSFLKNWSSTADRPWAGGDFWANRLQDWEVSAGRLQTRLGLSTKPLRTVHRLTTAVSEVSGRFLTERPHRPGIGCVDRRGTHGDFHRCRSQPRFSRCRADASPWRPRWWNLPRSEEQRRGGHPEQPAEQSLPTRARCDTGGAAGKLPH